MVYRRGAFAFNDVTDKGAARRASNLTLPPTKKACRDGSHLFSKFLRNAVVGGVEHIVAACPDCHEELSFPALAKDRK